MHKIFSILIILAFLSSCSSKEKIDDKGAVSVFLHDKNEITADKSLAKAKISVPKQQNNRTWYGVNPNVRTENFAFAKKISKIDSFKAGKDSGYDFEKVFAPIIAEGKIYSLDSKGNLFARNLSDGKKIWQRRIIKKKWFVENYDNGRISYFDGKIFATNAENLVFCFNAENGDLIWRRAFSSLPISAPISDGNQVFFITNDNKTYALDEKNGKIDWIHEGIDKITGILGAAKPMIYKNYLVSAYSSGEIYALSKQNGQAGWVFDLNVNKASSSDFLLNDIDASPVVKEGIVYAVGNGGLMLAIRMQDGVVLWQRAISSIANFWMAGDFIYVIDNDAKLICLQRESGKVAWVNQLKKYDGKKKPKNHIVYFGVLMAGDNLVLTNSKNELLLASPSDGKILQKKKLPGKVFSTPIVVDKKMYLHALGRFYGTKLLVIE